MQMAHAALGFDVSAFKRGIRDAQQIIKNGLGATNLFDRFEKNANTAVAKLQAGFKTGIAQINKGLSAFGLGTIGEYAKDAARALTKFTKEGVEQYNRLADAQSSLRATLEARGGPAFAAEWTKRLEDAAQTLSKGMGISQVEGTQAMTALLGRGATPDQAIKLSSLAAGLSKRNELELGQAARLVAEGARGSAGAMRKMGLKASESGDAARDGKANVEAMMAAFGNIGLELTNADELLSNSINDLKITWGELMAPALNEFTLVAADLVRGLNEILRRFEALTPDSMKTPTRVGIAVGSTLKSYGVSLPKQISKDQYGTMLRVGLGAVPVVGTFGAYAAYAASTGEDSRGMAQARIANGTNFQRPGQGFSLPGGRGVSAEDGDPDEMEQMIQAAERRRSRTTAVTSRPVAETRITIQSKSPNRFARTPGGP